MSSDIINALLLETERVVHEAWKAVAFNRVGLKGVLETGMFSLNALSERSGTMPVLLTTRATASVYWAIEWAAELQTGLDHEERMALSRAVLALRSTLWRLESFESEESNGKVIPMMMGGAA